MRWGWGGAAAALGLLSCTEPSVTREEAQKALDSARVELAAHQLTYDVLELSTSFTVGEAVAAAAEELRAAVESQISCAQLTLSEATLTVDFGALDDGCSYRGRTYAGVWRIRVDATAAAELAVHHEWEALTDGEVSLSGLSDVTWSADDASRHVVHDITWTDAREGEAIWWSGGDRTQQLLDPDAGLAGGILIGGERVWTVDEQMWQLTIEDVGVRLQDPVPQQGVFRLTTPEEKELSLTFERSDADTIEVRVQSGQRELTLEVHSSAEGS